MKRCLTRGLLSAGLFLLQVAPLPIALGNSVAHAQSPTRTLPTDVKRGQMVVIQPPDVTLDGKAERLSPGARIRNTQNMLLLSGSVVGKALPVIYRRDPVGLIHEVWVLTPDEAAQIDDANGGNLLTNLLNLIFGTSR